MTRAETAVGARIADTGVMTDTVVPVAELPAAVAVAIEVGVGARCDSTIQAITD